jgi:tryptophanase
MLSHPPHLDDLAAMTLPPWKIEVVYAERESVPDLRMTSAPEHLRFFQARFEPLAPLPRAVRA